MALTIKSNFPNNFERDLLQRVCRVRKCNSVNISKLSRFGFSGASLLILYFGSYAKGKPFLLKVAEAESIRREWKGVAKWRNKHDDCYGAVPPVYTRCLKWGAILYPHLGAASHLDIDVFSPKTFRETLFSPSWTCKDLSQVINRIFETLNPTYKSYSRRAKPLRSFLSRYFRGDEARSHIERTLGYESTHKNICFLGCNIYNPLLYLNQLPETINTFCGTVHGDLHPDNIIIDKDAKPHLIDFAWADKQADILVDHVLLESSIRFRNFPPIFNMAEQGKIDMLLLKDSISNTDVSSTLRTISHPENRTAYERIITMTREIRKNAREALTGLSFDHYLLIQFVVLYGLLKYENSYNCQVCTRYLGMIASHLHNISKGK